MPTFQEIFKKFESDRFSESYCFLCGILLDNSNSSKEHVIPKWIQRKFNLWSQKLTISNKTNIEYRYLTIPCCKNCNNNYLKSLEDKVKNAVEKGVEEVRKLDKYVLYFWLSKVYFGLVYKELFLFNNQKDPAQGTIVTPEYLDSFKTFFLFMQGIRRLHNFNNFFPASLFIVETKLPKEREKQWDFIDTHAKMFISCRIGNVGLIACLQDGTATQEFEKYIKEYFEFPLHPLQFTELSVKILYQLLLFNRTPKFLCAESDNFIESYMSPLGGMSGKPLYDKWNNNDFAKLLSFYTGLPIETINPENDRVLTWIKDENNNPLLIEI